MPRATPNYVQISPNGCWVWAGPKDCYGKPITSIKGRVVRVQYLFYLRHYQRVAQKIGTKCGSPFCINPEHLVDVRSTKKEQERLAKLAEINDKLSKIEIIIANLEGAADQAIFVEQQKELLKEKEKYVSTNPSTAPAGDAGSVQSHPEVQLSRGSE